jgi:hypothetical protein
MKKELLNELVESIKEAGKVHRGEIRASREFTFEAQDLCAMWEKLHKSQSSPARSSIHMVRRARCEADG